ncbi:hypothetical protein HJC23_013792 [Cyclotella cryptica]|uniref:Uncharacterized protein n=1 Tax=Cyclotella cryptica TaxID=29204 RepID=A0ABD3PHW1_9STRA
MAAAELLDSLGDNESFDAGGAVLKCTENSPPNWDRRDSRDARSFMLSVPMWSTMLRRAMKQKRGPMDYLLMGACASHDSNRR